MAINNIDDNRPRMSLKRMEKALVRYEKANIHVTVAGVTGIGKTQVMKNVAEKTGRIMKAFQPACIEGGELTGMPDIDFENEVVRYFKNELTSFEEGKKYMLLIDDVGREMRSTSQALLGFMNKPALIGVHTLENIDLWVVLTCNDSRLQKGVVLNQRDDAMKTRTANIVLVPKLSDYVEYFEEIKGKDNLFVSWLINGNNVIPQDIAMIYDKPVENYPCPRNLESCCDLLVSMTANDKDEVLDMLPEVQGIAGQEVMTSFMAYMEKLVRLNPENLLKVNAGKVFTALVNKKQTENTEALVTAFTSAVNLIDDKTDKKKLDNLLTNLLKLGKNYDEVIASVYRLIRDKGVKPLMRAIAKPDFIDHFLKFQREE